MSNARLDPDLQREMADQPQARTVEIEPGLTALVPPGVDPEEVRRLHDTDD